MTVTEFKRWRAAGESYNFSPAQRGKLKQIQGRASILSILVCDDDGSIHVGAEMIATGRERSYEITLDGTTKAEWTYA